MGKEPGDGLAELLERHRQSSTILQLYQLDLKDLPAIAAFAREVSGEVADGGGLGCLINNAGVSPKAARYNRVTPEQMSDTFAVNATAPLLLARDLLGTFTDPGLVVNLSSSLG